MINEVPNVNLIKKKYFLALGGIALLLLISQLTVQLQIRGQEDDAHIINIAGRQRMLSQKLAKSLLSYSWEKEPNHKDIWKAEILETKSDFLPYN